MCTFKLNRNTSARLILLHIISDLKARPLILSLASLMRRGDETTSMGLCVFACTMCGHMRNTATGAKLSCLYIVCWELFAVSAKAHWCNFVDSTGPEMRFALLCTPKLKWLHIASRTI